MLKWGSAMALVRADNEERKIVARVRGDTANARQQLLALVRYDMERINGEFHYKLDIQEQVPIPGDSSLSIPYRKLLTLDAGGIKEFPEVINGKIVNINVSRLLSGVDFSTKSKTAGQLVSLGFSAFLSYSHRDESLRDRLEVHLKLLQRQRLISTWHDRKLMPGEDWRNEIDNAVATADIILLLVSADFLASDYIWDHEMKVALERHQRGEAVVIPILVKPCDWENAPFANIQGLPRNMRPVTTFRNVEEAWTEIAKTIRRVVEEKNHFNSN